MSPLTKLFVVLLVLVSIIQTAGIITFVNKLEPLQADLLRARADAQVQMQLATNKSTDLAAVSAELADKVNDLRKQKDDFNTQLQTYRTTIESRDAQLAKLQSDHALLLSANAGQATALQLSEDSKAKLSEQVVALRKDADERQRQNNELGARNTELTALNAVLNRDLRHLTEQLTELNAKNTQLGNRLREMGVSDAQIASNEPVNSVRSAPAINGVVRSRRTIAGKDYATISIGSADQVTKGMEFKILDKETGAFLGVLTVDVLDANEAMGQIIADPNNLAQIKPGNVVKTQI